MAWALLVGAAPTPVSLLIRLYELGDWSVVIAVDGGYETLRAAGIAPTVALGDFDSLGYVPQDVPVQRHNPIKDQSDLELALETLGDDVDTVLALGVLGGRLDHTVASLMVLARASERGFRTIAVHEDQAVTFLAGPATYRLPAMDTGVVSVMAMDDTVAGVTIEGLAYELLGATLTNRTSLGLSNEYTGATATVAVEAGTLAIFYPVEALLTPALWR